MSDAIRETIPATDAVQLELLSRIERHLVELGERLARLEAGQEVIADKVRALPVAVSQGIVNVAQQVKMMTNVLEDRLPQKAGSRVRRGLG